MLRLIFISRRTDSAQTGSQCLRASSSLQLLQQQATEAVNEQNQLPFARFCTTLANSVGWCVALWNSTSSNVFAHLWLVWATAQPLSLPSPPVCFSQSFATFFFFWLAIIHFSFFSLTLQSSLLLFNLMTTFLIVNCINLINENCNMIKRFQSVNLREINSLQWWLHLAVAKWHFFAILKTSAFSS